MFSITLTKWTGTLIYTIEEVGDDQNKLVANATINMQFRGDVHKYRKYPSGETFRNTSMITKDSENSESHWHASGKITNTHADTVVTKTWNGQGVLFQLCQHTPVLSYYLFGISSGEESSNQQFIFPSALLINSDVAEEIDVSSSSGHQHYSQKFKFCATYLPETPRKMNCANSSFESCNVFMEVDPSDYSIKKGEIDQFSPGDHPWIGPRAIKLEWTRMEARYRPVENSPELETKS